MVPGPCGTVDLATSGFRVGSDQSQNRNKSDFLIWRLRAVGNMCVRACVCVCVGGKKGALKARTKKKNQKPYYVLAALLPMISGYVGKGTVKPRTHSL